MKNLFERVTDQIISLMEQGQIPWHKPWTGSSHGAISHSTGKPYSLLNQILLQRPGEYITFLQCQSEGGKIMKGVKASHVYFWTQEDKPEKDENSIPVLTDDGKQKTKTIPIFKTYAVFHIDDCEGIHAKWENKLPAVSATHIDDVDNILSDYIKREGITLIADQISDRAFYSPGKDLINLPCISQFTDTAEYYSTAYHEAVHSTGHPSRLHRFEAYESNVAFGSDSYSREELVAEIGAACILHKMGLLSPKCLTNSAAYIQGWLSALRNDKKLIIAAATRAEKAVTRIMNINSSEQGPGAET